MPFEPQISKYGSYFEPYFGEIVCLDGYAIQRFLVSHARLSTNFLLDEAPFWTPTQAAFLRQAILQDSDWVEMVDQMSVSLQQD